VQEGVHDRLVEKLKRRAELLRVGRPLDKTVDMGAVVAPVQLERIAALVEQGRAEGGVVWQPAAACPADGWFYPPTVVTNVSPSSTVAQTEIFGPVVAVMPFRTPAEAVALANNTSYGLAASVWSDDINLALDVAPKLKAGVVWINATNLFDAAAGFGGYRESGFGREGGREGMEEYLRPASAALAASPVHPAAPAGARGEERSGRGAAADDAFGVPPIDRTAKLYVGGKQARPDSGYTRRVVGADGRALGEVGEGNRKDVRKRGGGGAPRRRPGGRGRPARARAGASTTWREPRGARRRVRGALDAMTGRRRRGRGRGARLAACSPYAAWADKYDGAVHNVRSAASRSP
jgi:aldehyde dehydrogenase (NAD+)